MPDILVTFPFPFPGQPGSRWQVVYSSWERVQHNACVLGVLGAEITEVEQAPATAIRSHDPDDTSWVDSFDVNLPE